MLGAAGGNEPDSAEAALGRRDEACVSLAAIYGWFTEGFDTADLHEAKALLEDLSACS